MFAGGGSCRVKSDRQRFSEARLISRKHHSLTQEKRLLAGVWAALVQSQASNNKTISLTMSKNLQITISLTI
jgi:hypothetical protein